MPTEYTFAFWNVENLFDAENYPERSEKLQRAVGKSLEGWTQTLLERKINQLATVIRGFAGGRGPDLLGVCEIENRHVLELLVQSLDSLGRDYRIAHADTQDKRGIDVAFIYDGKLFSVPSGPGVESIFSHFILKRTATRDILQVNFTSLKKKRLLVLMGNHWPSRTGGESESAAYRMMAGETLAYFHSRILEVQGETTPVLAMGDFNDEPFDVSLTDYALGIRSASMVARGRNPYFLNLMWGLMGKGNFTHYFNGPNMLDQFLANRNFLLADSAFKVKTVEVIRPPFMVESSTQGPIPFGGMGKPINRDGYSDHFPIQLVISEAD